MNPKHIFYGVLAGSIPIWLFLAAIGFSVQSGEPQLAQTVPIERAPRGAEIAATMRDLNTRARTTLEEYRVATAENRVAKKEALAKLLEERKGVVQSLMEVNPALAIENAFPDRDRLRMPEDVRNLIEARSTISGRLAVVHGDNFENPKQNTVTFAIEHDNRVTKLYPVNPLTAEPNVNIDVDGVALDGVMALWGDSSTTITSSADTTTTTTTSTNTTTNYPVLVLLADYNDSPARVMTKSSVENWLRTSVIPTISSNSYGKITPTVVVYDWYRFNRTAKSSTGSCSLESSSGGSSKVMQALGLSASGYRSVLLLQLVPCTPGIGGEASLGSYSGGTGYATVFARDYFPLNTTVHELGHNMSLLHSSLLNCQGSTFGGTCKVYEYGNLFDMMGTGGFAKHLQAAGKQRLSWMPSSSVQTVTQTGTYMLSSLDTAAGIRALNITASNGTKYVFEHRTASGIDSAITNSTNGINTQGVFIYRYGSGVSLPRYSDKYLLLDATPNTVAPPDFGSGTNWSDEYKDISDVTLRGARTITDPQTGISFGPVSAPSSAGISVVITFPGDQTPTLTTPPPTTTTTTTSDTTVPVVTISAPSTGSVLSGTVTLQVTASDNSGTVTRVEFYRGTTLLASKSVAPYQHTWDTKTVANGSYSITAKAFDSSGNSKVSSPSNVTVSNVATTTTPPPTSSTDVTAPTVRITAPMSGTTVNSGKVIALSAIATDNIKVTKVVFSAGGSTLCTDITVGTNNSFGCSWTPANRKTLYLLRATAYDAAGNKTLSSAVTVTTR